MSTFDTTLTPTPAAGKAIPYTWFTKLRDSIDALKQGDKALDFVAGLQLDLTTTGTVNDWAPGTGVTLRVNNATALVITGLVAHVDGDIRIIENVGSSTIKLTHQDAGSAAANRIILGPAMQWLGANGAIGLRYDGTADRWRVLFVNPGAPITPAYAAGDYTASAGTWTVDAADVVTCAFRQHLHMLDVELEIESTDVSATPTTLNRVIPGGFTAAKTTRTWGQMINAGTANSGLARVVATSTAMEFFRDFAATAWSLTAADNTSVRTQIRFEVQ
jgi:hypothetical protein